MRRPVGAKILSAGIIPVRLAGRGHEYLILRAYGNWDFPKGVTDSGEKPIDCARRELEEETGLTDVRFRWGMDFRETLPYARGKVARYYLAEIVRGTPRLPIAPWLGKPEHHEYRWTSYEEAHELLPQRLLPILDWAESVLRSPSKEARTS